MLVFAYDSQNEAKLFKFLHRNIKILTIEYTIITLVLMNALKLQYGLRDFKKIKNFKTYKSYSINFDFMS